MKEQVFIGIDPSINSSGIWVSSSKSNNKGYIIHSGLHLTKKEIDGQNKLGKDKFEYLCYDKKELKGVEDNHLLEEYKTQNFIMICDLIKGIIEQYKDCEVKIVIEGISYGSTLRTKSVFDLAGLNFMIRQTIYEIINKNDVQLWVCTPGEIKKQTTGKGNAKKDIIIDLFKKVQKDYLVLPKVDDIADAYFMCQYSKELTLEKEI